MSPAFEAAFYLGNEKTEKDFVTASLGYVIDPSRKGSPGDPLNFGLGLQRDVPEEEK